MQYLMKRIEKAGKIFTSLRFKRKDWDVLMKKYPNKPVRENSRYVYLEIEGDILNMPRGRNNGCQNVYTANK